MKQYIVQVMAIEVKNTPYGFHAGRITDSTAVMTDEEGVVQLMLGIKNAMEFISTEEMDDQWFEWDANRRDGVGEEDDETEA